MGFRFRKSVKVLPGVRLNVTNKGVSTSVGVKGSRLTIGKKGMTSTTSIPGSGISHTSTYRYKKNQTPQHLMDDQQVQGRGNGRGFLVFAIAICGIGYAIHRLFS
jgi:hypothetical protein